MNKSLETMESIYWGHLTLISICELTNGFCKRLIDKGKQKTCFEIST